MVLRKRRRSRREHLPPKAEIQRPRISTQRKVVFALRPIKVVFALRPIQAPRTLSFVADIEVMLRSTKLPRSHLNVVDFVILRVLSGAILRPILVAVTATAMTPRLLAN